MQADGQGWLYVPQGLEDGPMPTHYEPHESPVDNPLYLQQANPGRQQMNRPENPYNGADGTYPYVLTTYRLTEHHTAGGMSRSVPYLAELQPALFCEVSPSSPRSAASRTAAGRRSSPHARRSKPGSWSPSGASPLTVAGAARAPDRAAVPLGHAAPDKGRLRERPSSVVLDPNVHIQEVKALTCDIRPGRRAGRAGAFVASGGSGG